jgi:hypothetical protein
MPAIFITIVISTFFRSVGPQSTSLAVSDLCLSKHLPNLFATACREVRWREPIGAAAFAPESARPAAAIGDGLPSSLLRLRGAGGGWVGLGSVLDATTIERFIQARTGSSAGRIPVQDSRRWGVCMALAIRIRFYLGIPRSQTARRAWEATIRGESGCACGAAGVAASRVSARAVHAAALSVPG